MRLIQTPAWTTRRRCKICDKLVSLLRLKRWPRASLCGSTDCTETHRKRRNARRVHRRRAQLEALDPNWKAERNKAARERYWRRKPSSDTPSGLKRRGRVQRA